MAAPKMVVLVLKKTKGVVGAITRQTPGVPAAVSDVVGRALVLRPRNVHATILIPPEELDTKEVDHDDAVFYDPRAHVLDGSAVTAPAQKVSGISYASGSITVTLNTGSVADKKTVLVAIENGSKPAVLLTAKTTLNVSTIDVPIPVPVDPGAHQVFASAEGFGGRFNTVTIA